MRQGVGGAGGAATFLLRAPKAEPCQAPEAGEGDGDAGGRDGGDDGGGGEAGLDWL